MTLERLINDNNMSSDQLEPEIEQRETIILAGFFDNVEYYLDILELTPTEKTDVRESKHLHGTQIAMNKCLLLWREHNPSKATRKALLEILLILGKEELASKVCRYFLLQTQLSHC